MKYEEFKRKATALKSVSSVRGSKYNVLSVRGDTMFFQRNSTRRKFDISLIELYKVFCELYLSNTPINTKTLEPYMDTAKSAALGLLIATGFVDWKHKQNKASRTEKTICLAVSPALKAYGTGGRPRLFEVVQKVREENRKRGRMGKSYSAKELSEHPGWQIDYLVAPPRMAHYITYSTRIYEVYLRYIAPEDIHVYSIDEVFIDATSYLDTYGLTAH